MLDTKSGGVHIPEESRNPHRTKSKPKFLAVKAERQVYDSQRAIHRITAPKLCIKSVSVNSRRVRPVAACRLMMGAESPPQVWKVLKEGQ
jgi:hypothetical protein